jgi:hypothetical protein
MTLFNSWRNNLQSQSKTIIRDKGKEYLPTEVIQFAKNKSITIRESAPRTPEQNKKAEIFS